MPAPAKQGCPVLEEKEEGEGVVRQHLPPRRDRHALDIGENRRLEILEFLRQFFHIDLENQKVGPALPLRH
jgi:hypothetical protein